MAKNGYGITRYLGARRAESQSHTGRHDAFFNNKRCVVVPPGIVEHAVKHVTLVAEYAGDVIPYLAEMTMLDFCRKGLER